MVEFSEAGDGAAKLSPSGKRIAERFAAVRSRGLLNSGLDVIANQFLEDHPDMAVRWELYNPKMDQGEDMVQMREAMGYRLVDWSELVGSATDSTAKSGKIRRGDLVLMCAPKEVDDDYRRQDQEAAHADLQAPKQAFNDALEGKQVRLSSGDADRAKGIGQIKVRDEIVQVPSSLDSEGGS